MKVDEAQQRVAHLMPQMIADLESLVAIPSCAFPGQPSEPVEAMAARTLELLQEAGMSDGRLMDVPDGYPPIYGEIPGPPGSPVVMLYAHYDVQPAPMDQGWTSDPWTPTHKGDGRIYGRGAADDKAGIAMHLGMLRAFRGELPCTVRVIVEGMEETNSNLETFVENHPDLFDVDVFIIADMGNLRVGEPVLTTTLRGDVACVVTVSTLAHPLHSGVFGGAAPDAMIAMARLLATLHDEQGRVAVEGVTRFDWDGADMAPAEFADSADLLDGVQVIGHDSVADTLWAEPSVSAIGLDVPSVADSSNVLIPQVRAKISMRIVPGADPVAELDALVRHLESNVPWGAHVSVERTKEAPAFRCATDGPAYAAARAALKAAYGKDVGEAGSGGSIPLLRTLQGVAPRAEFVLWGPEDVAGARIHASDESVDPSEIQAMTVAQVLFLAGLAQSD